MRLSPTVFAALALLASLIACEKDRSNQAAASAAADRRAVTSSLRPDSVNPGRVIHVVVALCDNVNQGIVPVPPRLGNGEDPQHNLYWGAAYGVRTFLARSAEWKLVSQTQNPRPAVLERCVFKRKGQDLYLVADAYRGAEIPQSITDFFYYVSGGKSEVAYAGTGAAGLTLAAGSGADLIIFVGHDGLMDFSLPTYPKQQDSKRRDVMILCCASKSYFSRPLRQTGANPILWTTGLMAPEAYVLKAGIDGWILSENGERIRTRAAEAYNTYQHCGLKAARNLFATGW